MRYLLLIIFLPFLAIASDYQIVFVHIGRELPDYAYTAIRQAKLFNPKGKITLLANTNAIETTKDPLQGVNIVPAESLTKTEEHTRFIRTSRLDRRFREGFWFVTTERLFYLDDYISQYNLENVFHLENDNMLYVNLEDLLPVFTQYYPGIGAPFEQDNRGAASFIYIHDKTSIHAFAKYLLKNATSGQSEMYLLSDFKTQFGVSHLSHLPTMVLGYEQDHDLIDSTGRKSALNSEFYSNHVDLFGSVFDMCSYGQYLGGIDPRNGNDGPGYINPCCVFQCNQMNFIWESDDQGRKIPYAIYKDRKYRLNNLHIHSKDLKRFASTNI